MSVSAIVMMIIMLIFTWGAFIFSLSLAIKKEKQK
ncbi:MAG: MetS family NSS transporter small subunit [Deferribacteres bacterium]|nr:MetS family NSS transporter small subunit [candidate division KSB1 bacterium]MCB9503413.1 MetS family NSS transporter small subunit [Deferribacteres bacterium]